ncbi:hypothetical protein [Virgibacillus halophilus]|uniref:hypothetical protein n=1 Tax=Tigheibacillus halophilus TaxID=361280 RepID=UPI003AA7B7D2
MKQFKNVQVDKIGFHEGLQRGLSTYPIKTIQENGSVSIERVKDPYFLVNDKWNINDIGEIKQFEKLVAKYNFSNKNIHFEFSESSINLEVKYVYYQQLFNNLWSIKSIYS